MTATFRYLVPAGLDANRKPLATTAPLTIGMSVSIDKNSPRLDIRMQVENTAKDHRLRVHFPLPFQVVGSYADTAYHVTRRPVTAAHRDPGSPELELPTYPMRSFVDLHGAAGGLALIANGLHEYEVVPGEEPELALTLLRAVGWLSRDDLSYRTGHAGPPMETPGAQVLGRHEFHYSLFFHEGGWEAGGVWRAAESVLLPLVPGDGGAVSREPPSIQVSPACIQMTACVPSASGYDLRLLNASDSPQAAVIEIRPAPAGIERVALNGESRRRLPLTAVLPGFQTRAWEIVTLRVDQGSRV